MRAPRKDYAIILKGVEDGGGETGPWGDGTDHQYYNHNNHHNITHSNQHQYIQPQWFLLAAILDRLCLILYVAICIISLLSYSSVL